MSEEIAASFDFNLPPLETIEILAERENLVDHKWLFGHIPWSNHDGKIAKVILKGPTEAFIIGMDGYATETAEIKEIEFDNVIISAMHGFAGNSYIFDFKLNEESVGHIYEPSRLAFTRDDVKDKFIKTLEQKIKGLNNQINNTKENIEKIKTL
jgi:hypothetical protein